MTAIPSGFLAASLRPDPVVAPVGQKIRSMALGRRLFDKLDPLTFSRYLAAFFVGVAATLTWQSYLGWSSQSPVVTNPADHDVNAILLDTVKRSIEKLAASQEQMAREINKIQAAQFVLYRHPADVRPAPAAPAGAAATAGANPPAPAEADARSDWRRQPCCQWPATSW